jgi:helicase MOV-10
MQEAQQKKNFRRYDLAGVNLHASKEGDELWHKLMVGGLAERRPSVLKGDSVYVWVPGTTDVEYEGFVQEVLRDATWLQLNPCFQDATRGVTEFNVRFSFSRIQFRRMHTAIDNVDLSLVWPDHQLPVAPSAPPLERSVSIGDWALNADQRVCVERSLVLATLPRKHPFLIRGAFGTGKTSTLCNVVLQLLHSSAGTAAEPCRILLCTECNAAADLYVTLLAKVVAPSEMLRSYQAHRTRGQSTSVWEYCKALYDQTRNIMRAPTIEELLGYRLIICTFDHSAVLWGIGCPTTMFTHIVMDEVANALEPRALIPLQLAIPSTSIVMAGDDKQIGPQVQSPSARHHGLKQSMLVRLVGLDFYQKHPETFIELKTNYRSHPKLLDLPSRIFYNGNLVAGADVRACSSLCQWERLPVKGLPLMFVGVEGKDEQTADSPGFLNKHEAAQIVTLIQSLLLHKLDGKPVVTPSDIAVVAAFHKQTLLIRNLLRKKQIFDVDV